MDFCGFGKITLLVIIILFLLATNHNFYVKKFNRLSKISMENFLQNAKTGDMLMTRYNSRNPREFFIYNALVSPLFLDGYTHANIVVRINGGDDARILANSEYNIPPGVYVYTAYSKEGINYDNITHTYKSGTMLISAEDYIMKYEGDVCYYSCEAGLNAVAEQNKGRFLQMARENAGRDFEEGVLMKANTILKLYDNPDDGTRVICSQAVAMGLEWLGLGINAQNNIALANTHPGDIVNFMRAKKYSPAMRIMNPYAVANMI